MIFNKIKALNWYKKISSHVHKYYYADSAISGSRRVVRSVFSHTMVKGHRVSNRIERKLVWSARILPNSIWNIFMDTNSKAANHFVQMCRLICTFAINDLSFLRGRFAVRRTVRALQKRSTVTYLSTNELIYNVVQNLSENACCAGGWDIWVVTVCQSRYLLVSRMKRINIFSKSTSRNVFFIWYGFWKQEVCNTPCNKMTSG